MNIREMYFPLMELRREAVRTVGGSVILSTWLPGFLQTASSLSQNTKQERQPRQTPLEIEK